MARAAPKRVRVGGYTKPEQFVKKINALADVAEKWYTKRFADELRLVAIDMAKLADIRLPRVAFFALRDIEPHEELCYDYGYADVPGKTMPCFCGARNCKRLLY